MAAGTEEKDQQQLEALLSSGVKIPPQPKVLLEIDELLQTPNFGFNTLAAVINKDAGLSAAVFKIANSAGVGTSRRIESLDQAITLLGINPIINMVKCSALRQSISGNAEVYERFWDHATCIATIASAVARKLQSTCNIAPNQAYMAGLFMDCGVPILLQRFPDYCQDYRLNPTKGWPDLLAEDTKFSVSHTAIGYLVAKHWRLPDFIVIAIRDHHDAIPNDYTMRTMSAILLMAMHLHNRHYRWPEDLEWTKYRDIVLRELGLGEDGLPEFEDDILDVVWGT